MGRYETLFWLADGWGASRRDRQSGAYHPFVPDKLADRAFALPAATAGAVAQAQADIATLNTYGAHLSDTEPLARLILRSEALGSSRIEGLELGAQRLLEREALEELGVKVRIDSTEATVLNNISALQEGIEEAAREPLDVPMICSMNRRLLADTPLAAYGGILRDRQNWIGGGSASPVGASYVPPRPELVADALEDLVRFVNSSPLPPVAIAAIAHAQFETIHPFVDGNGRTGRALVHAALQRGLGRPAIMPPVSLVMAADRPGYLHALEAYRHDDEDAASDLDRCTNDWIEYFSCAVSEACNRALQFEETLCALEQQWRAEVRPRANSAADVLLGKLACNPVLSISSAARLTGRSTEAARKALAQLVAAGVLTQNARNRKSNLYVATEAVDAFTRYERALATKSGNTSVEKPVRPVPQRPRRR